MTTMPKIDRRAWLAAWWQKRRRARQAAALPPAESFGRLTEAGDRRVTEDGEQRTQD